MKFDPITKELFTDNNEFIKKMHCPYVMNWDSLKEVENNSCVRSCSVCDQLIVDTAYLEDIELLKMVRNKPDTCLKVDLNQHNIKIITNGILEKK